MHEMAHPTTFDSACDSGPVACMMISANIPSNKDWLEKVCLRRFSLCNQRLSIWSNCSETSKGTGGPLTARGVPTTRTDFGDSAGRTLNLVLQLAGSLGFGPPSPKQPCQRVTPKDRSVGGIRIV